MIIFSCLSLSLRPQALGKLIINTEIGQHLGQTTYCSKGIERVASNKGRKIE